MRVLDSTMDSFPASVSWDAFVAQDPRGHLLQSWAWGELKGAFGWTPMRMAIERDGSLVAGAQVLYRRMGTLTVGYVPKGPVLLDDDPATLDALIRGLRDQASRRRCIWLTLEPEWLDTEDERKAWLTSRGLEPSPLCIQPRRTIMVDLTPDEDALLAAMKPKWRYNIRLSMRRGVVVERAEAEGLRAFYALMRITGERDAFGIHSERYYRAAWELFAPHGRVTLLQASYEGKPLAALMPFAYNGQAWYMYGASSNEHRELMPNHQLQWRAMLWAKSLGCSAYDLWGIPDAEEGEGDAQDDLSGVGRFKGGFGGNIVRYVGAFADILNRPAYRLAMWARRFRAQDGG